MTGCYSSTFSHEYHTEGLSDSLEEDEKEKYAVGAGKINLSVKNVW